MKNYLTMVMLFCLIFFLTAADHKAVVWPPMAKATGQRAVVWLPIAKAAGQRAVVWLPIAKAAGPVEEEKSLAPNFKIKDLDQISVELSSFKNKNLVVLFFWTTWCPYCLKELKILNQTMLDLEKERITVLPINSGEPSAKVAKFAKNKGYTFRILLDSDSAVSDAYHIYGVPIYFLVDKKGYVRLVSNTFPHDEAQKLAKEK